MIERARPAPKLMEEPVTHNTLVIGDRPIVSRDQAKRTREAHLLPSLYLIIRGSSSELNENLTAGQK
jgi:hypothetical protein